MKMRLSSKCPLSPCLVACSTLSEFFGVVNYTREVLSMDWFDDDETTKYCFENEKQKSKDFVCINIGEPESSDLCNIGYCRDHWYKSRSEYKFLPVIYAPEFLELVGYGEPDSTTDAGTFL